MNAECLHVGPNKVKQSVFVIFFSLLPHLYVLIDYWFMCRLPVSAWKVILVMGANVR